MSLDHQRIPQRVFIVPYRDREEEKKNFLAHMHNYLREHDDWEICFAHQCDTRPFNRGAMKNIGFLAIKDKYPEHYQNITFIFTMLITIPALTVLFHTPPL